MVGASTRLEAQGLGGLGEMHEASESRKYSKMQRKCMDFGSERRLGKGSVWVGMGLEWGWMGLHWRNARRHGTSGRILRKGLYLRLVLKHG